MEYIKTYGVADVGHYDGSTCHYKDKELSILHREDGPAFEWPGRYNAWYLNGKLHREDGPAVERANGAHEWYINGEYVSEKAYYAIMSYFTDPLKANAVELETLNAAIAAARSQLDKLKTSVIINKDFCKITAGARK